VFVVDLSEYLVFLIWGADRAIMRRLLSFCRSLVFFVKLAMVLSFSVMVVFNSWISLSLILYLACFCLFEKAAAMQRSPWMMHTGMWVASFGALDMTLMKSLTALNRDASSCMVVDGILIVFMSRRPCSGASLANIF
jgi:hypothetical protein